MPVSNAHLLIKQFYEWELWGRGWQKAEYTVRLEPPFTPFYGHYISQAIIDDGKRPGFLSTIATLFKGNGEKPETQYEAPEKQALPYSYDTTLSTYAVTIPRQFKQSADRIEQLLVMLSYRTSPISFEIIASATLITLQWVCRDVDAVYVSTQINAFFPDCAVIKTTEDTIIAVLEQDIEFCTAEFGLQEECMRPIATPHLDQDPYTALFGIFARLKQEEYVIIQILFTGIQYSWADSMMRAACDNSGKVSFFIDAPDMPQLAKEKVARPLFAVSVRAATGGTTIHTASALLHDVAIALVHASSNTANALMPLSIENYIVEEQLLDMMYRASRRVGMLLNSKELVTLIHYPSPAIHTKKLLQSTHTTKAAPNTLIDHHHSIGVNEHHGIKTLVSLSTEQRLRHMHLIGATGTGKSTLLHSLILQDIVQGNGVAVLDPHGDLIEAVVANIPKERINDVVVIDPSDTNHPVSLNILFAQIEIEKELLASDLVALFKRFSTSWGDQMNSVFANAIIALVYNTKQYHVGDLRRFLIEPSFRTTILSSVTDPEIVYYWQKEFPLLKSTSIGPILTRLDSFLRPKIIRHMVCQKQSLDFSALMDTKKIVLVKLSHGLLGMENSYLLGALIVSKLQQTAMARQTQAVSDRIPFYCYIDEFHHFITPSMAEILTGTRKYALGLVLAHQNMQQVSKYDIEIATSLLSDAGTRVCFRLGDTDAKRLQEGFASFTADDLQNLPIGECIARVNTADADFNLAVIPYTSNTSDNYTQEIVTASRNSYSVPIPQPPLLSIVEKLTGKHNPPTPPLEGIIVTPIKAAHSTKVPTQEQIREHRYVQTFIKKMAEEHGYKASLEVSTPDGNGLIDVVIEKDTKRIAIEISVTTTPEWELHNIKKCLGAGYEHIVVCSANAPKLKQITQLITQTLSTEDQQKIVLVTPDTFQSVLLPPTSPKTDTVIKGYRVKVQYANDGINKQELLKSIIAASTPGHG